jgi:hypothetical protein
MVLNSGNLKTTTPATTGNASIPVSVLIPRPPQLRHRIVRNGRL